MRLKRVLMSLLSLAVLASLGVLLVGGYREGHQEFTLQQQPERPMATSLRLSLEEGKRVIALDSSNLIKSGITLARLERSLGQKELRAYGTVLPLQGLIDLYNAYIAARVQLEKSWASLEATHKEYERLKPLHAAGQNISDKAIQAAFAAWRSDEISHQAAQDTLRALKQSMLQQWGETLTQWLTSAAPALDRLLQQKDVLLQISLPAGTPISAPPPIALVETAAGLHVPVRLISSSPHTDPRFQGLSFFYMGETQSTGLLPGMNVVASLPVGAPIEGVVIPGAAVVWWQSRAWVYVQEDAGHFVRRAIRPDWPVPEGWFVSSGLAPGERVVVSGAQMLLSEEFRTQIQVGEE